MKATLEFDLDIPEDVEAHKAALHAIDLMSLIKDLDASLRACIKHGTLPNDTKTATQKQTTEADRWRYTLHAAIHDYSCGWLLH